MVTTGEFGQTRKLEQKSFTHWLPWKQYKGFHGQVSLGNASCFNRLLESQIVHWHIKVSESPVIINCLNYVNLFTKHV